MLFLRVKAHLSDVLTACFIVWLTLIALVLFANGIQLINHKTAGPLKIVRNVDTCGNRLKFDVTEHQNKRNEWLESNYRKRAKSFTGAILVDTSNDERKCPRLYKIARKILNGLKVELPAETNRTLWKFRERVDLKKLNETHLRWNYPWTRKRGKSQHTQELFRRYNVSAESIKQRKILLTYGHNCCNGSKRRAVEFGVNRGKMDYAEALDLSSLATSFQISHQNILRKRRGAGYWLWKPYIILQAMVSKLNDGDMLVYHDSGSYLHRDVGPLLKLCQEQKPSILTFTMRFKERKYSKRDAFILMGMDDPRVHNADEEQRLANLIVAMKNCETLQYFMEFLAYASDSRINTDRKNVQGKPNFERFVENRHDQTVHSLLSKKWGILSFRDPCACPRNQFDQRGRYASGPYKALYVHDHNRD